MTTKHHVDQPTAIVIGGGIAGLATATLLGHKGYNVTLIEQGNMLGGRAGWLTVNGFSFDTGPSWYLMPDVFEHFFQLLGRKVGDYFDLERLDPAYRVFSDEASPVTIHADLDRDAATFERMEPGAGDKLKEHVARAGKIYQMATRHFLYMDKLILKSFVAPDVLASLGAVPKTARLNSYIEQRFQHPLLRQILQYYSVFLGVSPYDAPSLYALMSHLDFNQGVYYPKGGMYQIIRAFERILQEQSVQIQLNTTVTKILSQNGRATGVVLADKTTIKADLVVSAADLHHTEQNLLDASDRSLPKTFWDHAKPSPSALLMYLGVKGRLPQLAHHNLIFTENWHRNFDDIFVRNRLPQPASMYVSATSITDPTVAPSGDENLFVLVPLPASDEPLSQAAQAAAATGYIAQLAAAIKAPDLAERLLVKQFFGPADFAQRFNAWRGNALGLGHSWGQSAWFRPAVKSRKLSNFYTVGANSRPGVGLPMCLISAQLVLKDLLDDSSDGPTDIVAFQTAKPRAPR